MTPESIVKITKALLKGLGQRELKMVSQYLIRRNVSWLPLRKIAEVTECDRRTVQTNIQKVYKNKGLVELANDVELLIRM